MKSIDFTETELLKLIQALETEQRLCVAEMNKRPFEERGEWRVEIGRINRLINKLK